jgi:hypothetical protein
MHIYTNTKTLNKKIFFFSNFEEEEYIITYMIQKVFQLVLLMNEIFPKLEDKFSLFFCSLSPNMETAEIPHI